MLVTGATAAAGSATWNLNPTSGDWNIAANWTPATVPNGPTDTATFDNSNITEISLSDKFEVASLIFTPLASAFTITTTENMTISGPGIVNNSAVPQNFIATSQPGASTGGYFHFYGSATAGNVTFTHHDDPPPESGGAGGTIFHDTSSAGTATFINEAGDSGGGMNFRDASTADHATFIMEGASISGGTSPGYVFFFGTSTAANGTFNVLGATYSNGGGSATQFYDTSTAGDAILTAQAGTVRGADGGQIYFSARSTAGNAVMIAEGGLTEAHGGTITFDDESSGGTARIEVFGNGTLDISNRDLPSVSIGSLEGDGRVLLGAHNLTAGKNNLSTTFSGTMRDGGSGGGKRGSLTKTGTGNLTLTGANTYTGGTTVGGGILLANNANGSGTGKGPVWVTAGTFGGGGTISGAVTVGTGSGPGAFLGPGAIGVIPGTLTIQKTLTLMADATYKVTLNSTSVTADEVSANGVGIRGAQILLDDRATNVLQPGTVFTVIDNTAATSIAGSFANLADGGTITIGTNTFQANYEGGDGNDLTLTVVP